jgi:hypothetical protein
MKGAAAFTNAISASIASTVDFNRPNGNRGTQAAAKMNQHAAALHFSCLQPFSGGSRRS